MTALKQDEGGGNFSISSAWSCPTPGNALATSVCGDRTGLDASCFEQETYAGLRTTSKALAMPD